jgi:hypothetical protein
LTLHDEMIIIWLQRQQKENSIESKLWTMKNPLEMPQKFSDPNLWGNSCRLWEDNSLLREGSDRKRRERERGG